LPKGSSKRLPFSSTPAQDFLALGHYLKASCSRTTPRDFLLLKEISKRLPFAQSQLTVMSFLRKKSHIKQQKQSNIKHFLAERDKTLIGKGGITDKTVKNHKSNTNEALKD